MIIWPGDSAQSSHWSADIGEARVFRLAILSTPRTGNTWLRRLLDGVYCVSQVVADSPAEIEWERLPPRCILQLHWDRDRALLEKLSQYGFRKITICRHPLDVLISILHLSSGHAETGQWVGGRGGGEEEIRNGVPNSGAFLKYATGPRADLLLSVSCQWVSDPECLVARYEDFVREPVRELAALCGRLQPAPEEAVRYAVEAVSMEKMRKVATNQHYWQGTPGLWTHLLPAQAALQIAAHHRQVFETLGYSCDLSAEEGVESGQQGNFNWCELEFATLKEENQLVRSQVLQIEQRLGESHAFSAELNARLAALKLELETMRADRWTPSVVARKVRSLARSLWPFARWQ